MTLSLGRLSFVKNLNQLDQFFKNLAIQETYKYVIKNKIKKNKRVLYPLNFIINFKCNIIQNKLNNYLD